MAKIKLYIAISIDGYIARVDGGLEWLTEFPNPNQYDYGYNDFYNSIGSVIMGAQTYYSICSMDVEWPYKDKSCYVISQNSMIENSQVKLIRQDIIEKVKSLKSQSDDIWLVGGGKVTSMLLADNLVDEMIITTIPILLGNGIPLFPPIFEGSNWTVNSINKFSNDVIQTTYKRKY